MKSHSVQIVFVERWMLAQLKWKGAKCIKKWRPVLEYNEGPQQPQYANVIESYGSSMKT